MKVVATCTCGGQSWTIFEYELECNSCGKVYPFDASRLVHWINKQERR